MYRTAILAQEKMKSSNNYGLRSSCEDLINEFNKGSHIIDSNNNENSYSILA